MSPAGSELPVAGQSVILPDPGGVLTALARSGYELEVALADLVDNSIDANARKILIRFFRTADRLTGVAIADDGEGIVPSAMNQAMGFGVDTGKGNSQLGKYGTGLKSASFSQARTVTVITRHRGAVAGRRWSADNIRAGWICDHIDTRAASEHLGDWGPVSLKGSGTVIYWDDLDAFRVARDRADGVLEDYFRRITTHLGLLFHRFISAGRVQIFIDALNEESDVRGAARQVQELDPFRYPESGRRGYPRTFHVEISEVGPLDVEAHIWPRRSRSPGYLLGGGKVAQRQGIYFYRNDRLIQAGGWNGLRDDAEPHSSLARARVDLPGEYDHAFALNLQKSGVSMPAGSLEAISDAEADGTSFTQYVRDAIATYRKRPTVQVSPEPPLIPYRGISRRLRGQVRRSLSPGRGSIRTASLTWRTLPDDQFFDLDRDAGTIYLNTRFRPGILQGSVRSSVDVPLVKMLLFLLVAEELDRQRTSEASREWLARCQDVLVAAAKAQMP